MRVKEFEKLKSVALLFEAENYRLRQVLETLKERYPEIKEIKWALEQPGVADRLREMDEKFPPRERRDRRGGKYRVVREGAA